jgi:hypothetical protein
MILKLMCIWFVFIQYYIFKHSVCFSCRLAQFEAEFDANPVLFRIRHFTGRYDRKTALTRCHKNTQKKNTYILTAGIRLAE